MKFAGDAAFDKIREGKLKLVKFSVLSGRMKDAVNNSQRLRDLIEWGDDARVAHEVFIVIEAELADQFNNNVTVDLSGTVKGIDVKVGGSRSASGGTVIRLSAGDCFAYLLLKFRWDASLKRNRTKVVDLEDDQFGTG